MATPARAPIVENNAWWRTPVLAGMIALIISFVTYSFSMVKNSGGDEVTIQTLHTKIETKVDKEKYDTDMNWIKETLKEMKIDIKEIKKEKR